MTPGTRIRDLEVTVSEAAGNGWRVRLEKVGPNCFGVRALDHTAATEVRCDAMVAAHCREFACMNEPERP